MTPTSAHPPGCQTPLGLGLSLTRLPLCPALWGLGVALQMPRGNLVSLAPSALRLRGEDSVEPTSHPGCRAHWGDKAAAPRVLTLGALTSGLGWTLRRCSPLLLCPGLLAPLCIPTPLDSDPASDEYSPLPFTPLPILLSHPHSEVSVGENPDHAGVACPGGSMRDSACCPGCLGLLTLPPPTPHHSCESAVSPLGGQTRLCATCTCRDGPAWWLGALEGPPCRDISPFILSS